MVKKASKTAKKKSQKPKKSPKVVSRSSTLSSDGRIRPKQERSRETVEIILQASKIVLTELGYEKFTTKKIAEKAGVSVGTLYQYFPNKEAVVLSLIEQDNERQIQIHNEIISRKLPTLYENVYTLLEANFAYISENTDYYFILLQVINHFGSDLRIRQVEKDAVFSTGKLIANFFPELAKKQKLLGFMVITFTANIVRTSVIHSPHLLRDPEFLVMASKGITGMVKEQLNP